MLRPIFSIRVAWLPGAVVLHFDIFIFFSSVPSIPRIACFDVSMFRSHCRNVNPVGSLYHDTVIEVYCDIAIPSNRAVLPTAGLLHGMAV